MIQVKQGVKPNSLLGGGLNGTSWGGCEPPWWSEDHHQGGGMGWWVCTAGHHIALQPTLVSNEHLNKNYKNAR